MARAVVGDRQLYFIQGEIWQLSVGGEKIYKSVEAAVHKFGGVNTIPLVWHKYYRIQEDWFTEVNWEAMEQAMNTSAVPIRHWIIIKRCARDCGVNVILHQRKEKDHDKCPFCGETETVEHIYLCPNNKVQEVWEKAVDEFAAYLHSIGTDPNILAN